MDLKKLVVDEIKENANYLKEDSGRIFHGRGGCFLGLEDYCIDKYGDDFLILDYSSKVDSDKLNLLKDMILAHFTHVNSVKVQSRNSLSEENVLIPPQNEITETCIELGLIHSINLEKNRNFGIFFDTRDYKEMLILESSNKKILNLFSYTCSLSLAALKGNASLVVNVDMAKSPLNTGKQNHEMNEFDLRKAKFIKGEVLKSIKKFERDAPFDLIIIDPPSFQSKSFSFKKDILKVVRKTLPFLAVGGRIDVMVNSPFIGPTHFLELISEVEYKEVKVNNGPPNFKEKNSDEGLNIISLMF